MSLTTLPTRGPLDLGPALSDTRAPTANELSAVHVEKIKDRLIEIATDIGTDSAPAETSLKYRVGALEEGGGGGGSGDVVGPGSSVDRSVAIFDGTDGELLASAPLTVSTDGGLEASPNPMGNGWTLAPATVATGTGHRTSVSAGYTEETGESGGDLTLSGGGSAVGPGGDVIIRGGANNDTGARAGVEIDAGSLTIPSATMPKLAADPSSPGANAGTIYVKDDGDDDAQLWARIGGTIHQLTPPTPALPAAADDGDVLTLVSGVPAWAPPSGGGAGAPATSYPNPIAGTTLDTDTLDDGAIQVCTAATEVTVTVNERDTASVGYATIEIVQGGAGQVVLAAGAGVTLAYPASLAPVTREASSTLVLTWIGDGDLVLVRGHMGDA